MRSSAIVAGAVAGFTQLIATFVAACAIVVESATETLVDAPKTTTSCAYDVNGRPVKVTHPDQVCEYTYDTRQLPKSMGVTDTTGHAGVGEDDDVRVHGPVVEGVGDEAERQRDVVRVLPGAVVRVLTEEVAGELSKSYQYSPWGGRLSQISHQADAENGVEAGETAYYGYNAHTDVETLTDETGNTTATYGYTAYGSDDTSEFTGIDKPEAGDPTNAEPYNAYRYNSKRLNAGSGTYDMGFRDYDPGLNRFTSRDMYNGALADMSLGTDAYTGNRYAFTAGDPINRIELDGHRPIDCADEDAYSCSYTAGTWEVVNEADRILAEETVDETMGRELIDSFDRARIMEQRSSIRFDIAQESRSEERQDMWWLEPSIQISGSACFFACADVAYDYSLGDAIDYYNETGGFDPRNGHYLYFGGGAGPEVGVSLSTGPAFGTSAGQQTNLAAGAEIGAVGVSAGTSHNVEDGEISNDLDGTSMAYSIGLGGGYHTHTGSVYDLRDLLEK